MTPDHFTDSGVPTSIGNPEDDDSLRIGEYITILLDDWKLLLAPILIFSLGTIAYLSFAVPTYRATGVIQVSNSEDVGAGAMLQIIDPGRPSPVETEVEILKSRRIVVPALHQLGMNFVQDSSRLTTDFKISLGKASPHTPELIGLRNVINQIYISSELTEPTTLRFEAHKDGSMSFQSGDDTDWIRVTVGEEYSSGGIRFRLSQASGGPPKGTQYEVKVLPNSLATKKALDRFSVSPLGGGRKPTNLVGVSFETSDRYDSMKLVNAIMESYMGFALDWRTLRADRTARFIESQLAAIRSTLESSEVKLQEFSETEGALHLPKQAEVLIQSSSEIELEMRKVQIQEQVLSMVEAGLKKEKKTDERYPLSGDIFTDDPLLADSISKLNGLEMKRELMLADVTESHPDVVRINDEVVRLRPQIRALLGSSRKHMAERRRSLKRAIKGIQTELTAFPAKERQLTMLTRNLEVSKELYAFLMTKLQESRILKASTTTDKRIIDAAFLPDKRNSPRRMTTFLFALVMGTLLGIGAVFARRAIDPRVRDVDEAKSIARLPMYGAIPDAKLLGLIRKDERLVDTVWQAPKGPMAESFRTLRTNIEFAQVGDDKLRVIQITSSQASEGKSTIIANLAIALSKAGHSVILVDLDLRRPSQHRAWGVPRTPGISDHLVGRATLKIRRVEEFKVDVIPAGNEPPESQRLLASKQLGELVEGWKKEYDYVLLDTPPLLVADSLVISKLTDFVLFVVRPKFARRTHVKLAQDAAQRMDRVRGLIINGVSSRRGGYYHYYRGSYYGSKTSDTQES